MFREFLFFTIVVAFYLISVWQYRNPVKATYFFMRRAYVEEPKVDEQMVRRSLIIRGLFFTVFFVMLYFNFFR